MNTFRCVHRRIVRPDQARLRTLSDAVQLRNHILTLFEQAAWSNDPVQTAALTTIVVVGGGDKGRNKSEPLVRLLGISQIIP